ncbi:unnamed protein product [Macrosiphum euphorbiae]|uniref:Uncharacterized protein n=1 Tax=Macrosiphum euphorbiae TaxID=13131 RepID=A0AAV0VUQ8_9HEMI|nr:unnamed protein product [Macrosiphum euphorbiae]
MHIDMTCSAENITCSAGNMTVNLSIAPVVHSSSSELVYTGDFRQSYTTNLKLHWVFRWSRLRWSARKLRSSRQGLKELLNGSGIWCDISISLDQHLYIFMI